jgi:hypothetical protein
MGPLTRGQRRGFQPRGEVPTEDEESQHGAGRGTGEFAPATVSERRFMPDKVSDMVRLQGVPIDAAGSKTCGQETPGHAHIVLTGTGGGPAHLLQILRIAQEPLVRFRLRQGIAPVWKAVLLMPEGEEMREPFGSWGQLACRGPGQPADIALDERWRDLGDGVPVLTQPPHELIAASQIPSDAVPCIPLLAQCTGKCIEVRT